MQPSKELSFTNPVRRDRPAAHPGHSWLPSSEFDDSIPRVTPLDRHAIQGGSAALNRESGRPCTLVECGATEEKQEADSDRFHPNCNANLPHAVATPSSVVFQLCGQAPQRVFLVSWVILPFMGFSSCKHFYLP